MIFFYGSSHSIRANSHLDQKLFALYTFGRSEYLVFGEKLKCINWKYVRCGNGPHWRQQHATYIVYGTRQRHVYEQTDFFSGKTWRQFKYDVFLLLFSYLTSSLEQFQERENLFHLHANNNNNNSGFSFSHCVCVCSGDFLFIFLLFSKFSSSFFSWQSAAATGYYPTSRRKRR